MEWTVASGKTAVPRFFCRGGGTHRAQPPDRGKGNARSDAWGKKKDSRNIREQPVRGSTGGVRFLGFFPILQRAFRLIVAARRAPHTPARGAGT